MANKFKVGDKIRYNRDWSNTSNSDQIITVETYASSLSEPGWFKSTDGQNRYEDYYELVERAEPAFSARMTVTFESAVRIVSFTGNSITVERV